MHIPDGYLDPILAGVTWAVMLAFGYYAYRRSELLKYMELVISLAAAIFVAQMLSWPIPGGTSLHFVGAALAAILLGPLPSSSSFWCCWCRRWCSTTAGSPR